MNNTCILIPALEPSYHFIDYVKALNKYLIFISLLLMMVQIKTIK